MAGLLDNPFAPTLLGCLAAGLLLSLLARLSATAIPASLVAPAVFLVGYVSIYQRVPGFPPVGSTSKVFYVAVIGTAVGLALDLGSRFRPGAALRLRRGCEVAAPAAVAAWIGLPRLADATPDFLVTVVSLAIGGAVTLRRLDAIASAEGADGGEMPATAMLGVLALGFAPIALFGASSTSLGLCLGLAVGLGAAALVALAAPRGFGAAAILGAGAGLLAVIDTVTLITQRVDMLALPVLLLVLIAGQLGARVFLPSGRPGMRVRRLMVAAMSAAPVLAIVAILFLRHPNPIG